MRYKILIVKIDFAIKVKIHAKVPLPAGNKALPKLARFKKKITLSNYQSLTLVSA